MKFPPAAVAHDLSLCEAVEIMVKNSSEILPVLENDRFAEVITWVELLKAALENCSPPGGCERDGGGSRGTDRNLR